MFTGNNSLGSLDYVRGSELMFFGQIIVGGRLTIFILQTDIFHRDRIILCHNLGYSAAEAALDVVILQGHNGAYILANIVDHLDVDRLDGGHVDHTGINAFSLEHFSGFVSVPIARGWPRMEAIPDKPGVYAVLRMNNCPPKFLRKSTGGRFKGKDPSVSIPTLRKKWVENASVLYVGQSGGKGGDATLRSRIERYLDFGKGENVGHWGGRYIWQLEEANDLLLCWKPSSDPRGLEKRLIGKFEKIYGRLPFANLQH